MPGSHTHLSSNNGQPWTGLLLATGISVFFVFVIGLDQGHANPKLDSVFGDLAVPNPSSGASNFSSKKIGNDLTLSYHLQKFEPEQSIKLASSEIETIRFVEFHSPENPKTQFARPVHFQLTPGRAWSMVHLYFDLTRVTLGDDFVLPIEKSVELYADAGTAPIYVDAYCDQRGGVGYSLALGARRIQLVKQYLLDLGISHRVIESVNYGSSRPPCGGATHLCERAQLRIQSTFDFFAIQEPKFGCVVRIKLAENLSSSGKGGFPAPSLLPYHTQLAPLR